ncbi:hypothetical protein RSA46_17515 [Pseudomonas oryzihabitans]|uniref:tape measure protein n=1 Tax=Pseudomonas rhizoryzae TaxID=2571129 RepID=UPI0007361C18|nr:tape measure protein [Pseudomonas rhizoryzae]KTT43223.1 hypothetical protein RSA46_17515 [Pseudomonas psychrotolerans]
MSTMNPVASFFASLGIKVDQRSFAQADRMLKNIQSTMEGFKKYQANLVIKPKISFNSLTLQRDIQKSMNQVAKLTQFKIDKFNIDASRLSSSLESAIRRAQHSAGSIKVRAIAERSPLSQSTRALVRQHEAGLAANGFTGGVGGLVAASRAGVAGIAGYVGYNAVGQANDYVNGIQDRVIRTDTARMLLDQAVGGNATRKTNALDWYKQTTNKYGLDAQGGIADYNTALTLQRGQGITTRDALKNYDSFLQRFTLRHLTSDQQKGSLRQITQILGRGTVQAEDLNSLVENGDPEIKNLIREAWAQRTNYKGQNMAKDYADAQKKGQVTSQDLLGAYALSAKRNAQAMEEASNSLRADAQRTTNAKFWSEMDRNSEELTNTLKARNDAEQKLIESTIPLQKLFTQLVEIPIIEKMTSFTNGLADFAKWADAIRTGAKTSEQAIEDVKKNAPDVAKDYLDFHPGVKGISWLWENHPVLKRVKDGAGSLYDQIMGPEWGTPGNRFTPDFQRYKELPYKYLQPVNDFQMPAMLPPAMPPQFGSSPLQHYQQNNDNAVQQLMNQSYTNNNTNNNDYSIRIEPGAIVINGTDLSAQDIGRELESQMKSIAERVQYNTISETIVNYPSIGR